jgi:hypothetical protein
MPIEQKKSKPVFDTEEAESPFLSLRYILPPERGAPLSVQFSSPALKRVKKIRQSSKMLRQKVGSM